MAHLFGNKFNLRDRVTQAGQALVELAVLGTVLIFAFTLLLRYGLSANYQQKVSMQAFRKAFVRARQYDPNGPYNRGQNFDPNWKYENAEPALPSNHWRNVNYTVIEDKPFISASGILPITERSPVAASTEALWSIDIFGQMKYGDEKDLPRTEFEINGRRYSFTVAAFKEYPEHDNMRIKEDLKDTEDWDGEGVIGSLASSVGGEKPKGKGALAAALASSLGDTPQWDGQGPSWRWKTISKVEEAIEKGELIEIDGEKVYVYENIDVDGDGYEEYVMKKSGNILKVLDYQEGEINLSEPIADSGKEKGGLQGYTKEEKVFGSTFRRQENTAGITTADNINAQEIFTRIIKTRDGDYDVVDTFRQNETKVWYTPNK